MKDTLIILLIVGLSGCDRPKETTAVELGGMERVTKTVQLGDMESVTKEEKLKLIEQLQTHFEYLASYEGWKENALDDFFFVDLDTDGDLDAVFTGWSGGEPVCVRLFNNRGGKYQEVFEAYQEIRRIELRDNKLSRISIHDPGCCAAYIEFDEDYSFDVNADDFKFILTNRTALLHPTEEPKEKFERPINFEVLNDKYFLRLTPKIDTVDQAFAEDMQPDNVIAEFKKGTRGMAYAEATDETGRVWWFVEIDPSHKPIRSLFYDIDEKPTRVKGWMSSNYLKKL